MSTKAEDRAADPAGRRDPHRVQFALPGKGGLIRIWSAVVNSAHGLREGVVTEAAIKQEIVIAAVLLPISFVVARNIWVWLALVTSVLLVLVVEFLNTAVERLCNHVMPERHDAIRVTKDLASTGVFIALCLTGLVWLVAVITGSVCWADLRSPALPHGAAAATSAGMTDAPPDALKIAVAQLNTTVGDIAGNLEKARAAHAEAAALGADLLVLTELFLCGYPPEDLVLRPAVQIAAREAAETLAAAQAGGPGIIVGCPWVDDTGLHNSVLLIEGGRIAAVRHKVELPNYGVFDELRVFKPGPLPGPVDFRGVRIGLPICEDLWISDVTETLAETGAELLIVPNGSPYWQNKAEERVQVALGRVVETGLPLIYANQLSGQDELVFDGGSFGLNGDRTLAFQMPQFETGISLTRWERGEAGWRCVEGPSADLPKLQAANWRACVLGLRDYVDKNGFRGVVLGLSGGIDSAVCAAMAVDALGAERVRCIMLPYRYTAEESLSDAAYCARRLGVEYDVLPIAPPVEGFTEMLEPLFANLPRDITEENLQSRTRGVALMAVSNKLGLMLLTTGNKSEVSVGYATIYGDMNGGFNPIKDLYKTEVYRLARYRNAERPAGCLGPQGEVIPVNIIDKAPTAELRENQKDQDSLPPYDELDAILEGLVEKEMLVKDIVALGYDRATVKRVEHLLNIAEYKRRQAAPGVKITMKNFGRDRRYPITNRFRDTT